MIVRQQSNTPLQRDLHDRSTMGRRDRDDLFVSPYVLHRPNEFGVRASWAVGVRSWLPVPQRDFLEKVLSFLPVPLSWLYFLPAEAKHAAGALHTLAQLPAAERLPSLLLTADTPIDAINALH